jgi:hypothetical protein
MFLNVSFIDIQQSTKDLNYKLKKIQDKFFFQVTLIIKLYWNVLFFLDYHSVNIN